MTAAIWSDDAARIAVLHDLPTFLPWEHVRNNVLLGISYTMLALTLFFCTMVVLVDSFFVKKNRRKATVMMMKPEAIRKVSFRLTNMFVNSVLGGLGLYHFVMTVPAVEYASPEQRTTGWESPQESSLYLLACIQMGYQLWSIPIGYFFVNEKSLIMMMHHVAVLLVAAMSGFFTNGYRFYNPFMYGIMELSSVPLAAVNLAKDHPTWIQTYPSAYSFVRHVFAALFLTIRVYMLLPRKYAFLCDCFHYITSSRCLWSLRILYSFCWFSAFFLACLQVYWGGLIVKSLMGRYLLENNKKQEDECGKHMDKKRV